VSWGGIFHIVIAGLDPAIRKFLIVMRGLVPRIHARASASVKTWMAGTSPAMTKFHPEPISSPADLIRGSSPMDCRVKPGNDE